MSEREADRDESEQDRGGVCRDSAEREEETRREPSAAGHPDRAARADRYAGRTFAFWGSRKRFLVERGATGAVLRTRYEDGGIGLTNPDELELWLMSGTISPAREEQALPRIENDPGNAGSGVCHVCGEEHDPPDYGTGDGCSFR